MPHTIEIDETVDMGPFRVNFRTQTCFLPDGQVEQLTKRELQVLARLSDEFRTREFIGESIAVEDQSSLPLAKDTISLIVRRLRDKLGVEMIEAKWGFGYRLTLGE